MISAILLKIVSIIGLMHRISAFGPSRMINFGSNLLRPTRLQQHIDIKKTPEVSTTKLVNQPVISAMNPIRLPVDDHLIIFVVDVSATNNKRRIDSVKGNN